MVRTGVLAPTLIHALRCPKSKQPLVYFPRGEEDRDEAAAFLLWPASRLRYRVERDVPVLLVDEAREVTPGELARILDRARSLGIAVP